MPAQRTFIDAALKPTISKLSPTHIKPDSIHPVTTVPRPDIENTSQ